MEIDIFPHILPVKYRDVLYSKAPPSKLWHINNVVPTLTDLDIRFRIMDKYEGLVQVLTLGSPAIESAVGAEDAVELARIANDEMAELINKYPDRFVAAVACLPMNNIEAALKEADRAITELGFRGVQIYSNVNGKPIDLPEFMPLYEKMARYNLPIWIHPSRESTTPDYANEKRSRYSVWMMFGWPYETTVAMTRLVFSGILAKYPNLNVITHHCGAMVPYFEGRIGPVCDFNETRWRYRYAEGLIKHPLEYYRMFYGDTAVCGYDTTPALMCAYAFWGADHLLFGTDMPYDNQNGYRYVRATIHSIEQMDIPDSEKKMIYEDNARRLLHLPI